MKFHFTIVEKLAFFHFSMNLFKNSRYLLSLLFVKETLVLSFDDVLFLKEGF